MKKRHRTQVYTGTALLEREFLRKYAQHIITELDTYGDPHVYALAEDYLRLHKALERIKVESNDDLAFSIANGALS